MRVGNVTQSLATTFDKPSQTEGDGSSWQSRFVYRIPIIPFVSTPLGIARSLQALYFGAWSIYRISKACFSYHWDRMLSRSDLPITIKRQWSETYERESRVLKRVRKRLARGFLEIIPIIGNIAIYYSVWYQGSDLIRQKRRELRKEKGDVHSQEKKLFSYVQGLNKLTRAISKEARDPTNFQELQGQLGELEDEVRSLYHQKPSRRKRPHRKH